MTRNTRWLDTLSLLHWALAAFTALLGLIPTIHVAIGLNMMTSPAAMGGPPPWFGPLFFGVGIVAVLLMQAWAAANVWAGYQLKHRTNKDGLMVVSAINMLNQPFGVLLGAWTITQLSDRETAAAFDAA